MRSTRGKHGLRNQSAWEGSTALAPSENALGDTNSRVGPDERATTVPAGYIVYGTSRRKETQRTTRCLLVRYLLMIQLVSVVMFEHKKKDFRPNGSVTVVVDGDEATQPKLQNILIVPGACSVTVNPSVISHLA